MIRSFFAKRALRKQRELDDLILEEKAKRLWYHGFLIEGTQRPCPGEHWPEDIIPLWCRRLNSEIKDSKRSWYTVQNAHFWEKAMQHLSIDEKKRALRDAGRLGNVHVFNCMDPDRLLEHASDILADQYSQDRIVHPSVLLWMQTHKYWNDQEIEQLMDVYNIEEWVRPGILELHGILEQQNPTSKFLQDWYVSLFRDFNFKEHIRINIVTSFSETVSEELWLDFIYPACASHLADIDVPLLHAVCGVKDPSPVEPALKQLHDSLISIATEDDFSNTEIEPTLSILMDLQPAENTLQLYLHACTAKAHILHPNKSFTEALDFSFEV